MILILFNRNTSTCFTGMKEVEKDNSKGDKNKLSLYEL